MRQIRNCMTVLLVGSCTAPGSFCAAYVPVGLNDAAAWAVIDLDRDAAENIAVNEDTYRQCP